MYTAERYVFPQTPEEALTLLRQSPANKVVAGNTWLRMGSMRIKTLIDLSRLGLNKVEERNGEIWIGAMTTLRDLETSPVLTRLFSGVLPKAVHDIVGVQFRNCATVGAGVYSGYGFSDPLCALLALDADVTLVSAGRMKLSHWLEMPKTRMNADVLTNIILPGRDLPASWQCFRRTATDFSVLNLCVVRDGDSFRVAVGARPGKAMRCKEAEELLALGKTEQAVTAVEKLPFGSNLRGSAEYRRLLAGVLLSDAMKALGEGRK